MPVDNLDKDNMPNRHSEPYNPTGKTIKLYDNPDSPQEKHLNASTMETIRELNMECRFIQRMMA